MAGIVSEEGSEAFNTKIENVKEALRGMPATTGRAELMCARTQGNTKASTLRSKRKIAEDRKGKARGSYGVRASSERDGKIVSSVSEEVVWRGDRYFKTANGLLLPVEWRDVYDWVVGRIAPASWRE